MGVIVCHAAGELVKSVDCTPLGAGPSTDRARRGRAGAGAPYPCSSRSPAGSCSAVRRPATVRGGPQAAHPHRRAAGRVDRRLPAVGPGPGRQHRPHPRPRVGRGVRLRAARLPPLVPVRLRPRDPAAVGGRPGQERQRPWGAGAALLGLALAPTLLGDLGRLRRPRPALRLAVRRLPDRVRRRRGRAAVAAGSRSRAGGGACCGRPAGCARGPRSPSTNTGCTSRARTPPSRWRCWRHAADGPQPDPGARAVPAAPRQARRCLVRRLPGPPAVPGGARPARGLGGRGLAGRRGALLGSPRPRSCCPSPPPCCGRGCGWPAGWAEPGTATTGAPAGRRGPPARRGVTSSRCPAARPCAPRAAPAAPGAWRAACGRLPGRPSSVSRSSGK